MDETWGNGHYSCYKCMYEGNRSVYNECKNCLTYTTLMKPYYKNWTKKEMSNADKIRSMSDEDLAEFLIYSEENYKLFTSDGKDFYTYEEALKHEIEWLKSPTTD